MKLKIKKFTTIEGERMVTIQVVEATDNLTENVFAGDEVRKFQGRYLSCNYPSNYATVRVTDEKEIEEIIRKIREEREKARKNVIGWEGEMIVWI